MQMTTHMSSWLTQRRIYIFVLYNPNNLFSNINDIYNLYDYFIPIFAYRLVPGWIILLFNVYFYGAKTENEDLYLIYSGSRFEKEFFLRVWSF